MHSPFTNSSPTTSVSLSNRSFPLLSDSRAVCQCRNLATNQGPVTFFTSFSMVLYSFTRKWFPLIPRQHLFQGQFRLPCKTILSSPLIVLVPYPTGHLMCKESSFGLSRLLTDFYTVSTSQHKTNCVCVLCVNWLFEVLSYFHFPLSLGSALVPHWYGTFHSLLCCVVLCHAFEGGRGVLVCIFVGKDFSIPYHPYSIIRPLYLFFWV